MVLTQNKVNRFKIPCAELLDFDDSVSYRFEFNKESGCCKTTTIEANGVFCGEYADFYIKEGCTGAADEIELPIGRYSLQIINTVDESLLYEISEVIVRPFNQYK